MNGQVATELDRNWRNDKRPAILLDHQPIVFSVEHVLFICSYPHREWFVHHMRNCDDRNMHKSHHSVNTRNLRVENSTCLHRWVYCIVAVNLLFSFVLSLMSCCNPEHESHESEKHALQGYEEECISHLICLIFENAHGSLVKNAHGSPCRNWTDTPFGYGF